MWKRAACLILGSALLQPALALNPNKAFTQYTRTLWPQAVSAITQTPDGYLWLGTSEGLLRFDGHEFVTHTKARGSLPSNSIITLHTGAQGTLWIGTNDGLASYKDGKFRIHKHEGVSDKAITSVVEDPDGALWMLAAGTLIRLQDGKVHAFAPELLRPIASPRLVYQDRDKTLWVAGIGGVIKRAGKSFVPVLGPKQLGEVVIQTMLKTEAGLWLGGGQGLINVDPKGNIRRYTTKDGLPNSLVLELMEDHVGTLWVGTSGGLSRFEKGRFAHPPPDDTLEHDLVWALLDDREGNLWMGTQNSLVRLRDDVFSTYGRSEGLPSDKPMAVHEDPHGQLWVAYRDRGLLAFRPGPPRTFTMADGLAGDEIYNIRDGAHGDLLISTLGGLSRMHAGRFKNYTIPDLGGRTAVHDALEDSRGRLWAAAPSGIYQYREGTWHPAVPSDSSPASYALLLEEGPDHSIWAGTFLGGLWKLEGPGQDKPRLLTTADGLGSNQIRSMMWDAQGTLWIGTFDGGLTRLRDGKFRTYRASDGLLSDNVMHVEDDQAGNLWLSTTKGVCRISKQQLADLDAGKIQRLRPINYGAAEGLRSVQMAPAFPGGGGGTRSRDGRLWFSSGNGLATIHPLHDLPDDVRSKANPVAHVVSVAVDGQSLDTAKAAELEPGFGRIDFTFVGLYLSAPQLVEYSYKLEGQDSAWTEPQPYRGTSYNNLRHGNYRFRVRAIEAGGHSNEASFAFVVLPHFYETTLFMLLASLSLLGSTYGIYRLRMAQMRTSFNAVFEERARLAREIHDTLAQGFVGISHQLDALAAKLSGDPAITRQHLDLARKMTRHSLTEARRSMMDLRMSELQEQDLYSALSGAAQHWVAGTDVRAKVEISGIKRKLPPELEQNLLRIAQEAVVNVLKHANARTVSVSLSVQDREVVLRIEDDGAGFDTAGTFLGPGGHFGIIGMRERAERLGGTFTLTSQAGSGTRVEVKVPCD